MVELNIAKEFSRYPAGRYRSDGPYSGEQFRDEMLLPYLETGQSIIINLDGTRGYGSSFLEEAFGGLVRAGQPVQKLMDLLSFTSEDPSLAIEIKDLIQNAE